MHRLETSLIIGVSCLEKKPGCFCEVRETDMSYSESCDLFLKDAGDDYEILYVSDKGREGFGSQIPGLKDFVNRQSGTYLMSENLSPDGDELTRHKVRPTLSVPLSLDMCELEMFDKIDWGKYTDICQGCGLCTFICPTCHCFDFKDVDENGVVCRYRNWDSCMFPKFTMHASGHNPRASIKERYRQRVLHKYSYIPENFGCVSCTGCGRCTRSCPAGVSIKSIVTGIIEDLS